MHTKKPLYSIDGDFEHWLRRGVLYSSAVPTKTTLPPSFDNPPLWSVYKMKGSFHPHLID